MRISYKKYAATEEIPVYDYVKHRKLVKYYTRETMAAMVAMGELFRGREADPDMPFFYSTGELEMLASYVEVCRKIEDRIQDLSPGRFMRDVVPCISPLTQFKMMRNMTLCFVSIEYGLKGDNAALLDSASALLYSALLTPSKGTVLLGAGRLYADNSVESGFAEVLPSEMATHPLLGQDTDPMEFFRNTHY